MMPLLLPYAAFSLRQDITLLAVFRYAMLLRRHTPIVTAVF